MKHLIIISSLLLILLSCNAKTGLKDKFNCGISSSWTDLDKLKDFKNNFTVYYPKNWKTKFYYDNIKSSIFSADTTVSFKKSLIMDATFIMSPTEIDKTFEAKIKSDNIQLGLTDLKSDFDKFNKLPLYYNLATKKDSELGYKVLNVFIKGRLGFLHIKTEIYGDSLVDERICKAVDLINRIEFE